MDELYFSLIILKAEVLIMNAIKGTYHNGVIELIENPRNAGSVRSPCTFS